MAKCKRGRQSFSLDCPPTITHWASIAGKKEAEGPLAHTYDITSSDTLFSVAKRFHTSGLKLAGDNGITEAVFSSDNPTGSLVGVKRVIIY